FYNEGYEERQQKGEAQKQLSKEFVREWLIANNFMGLAGQQIPEMSDTFIQEISERYIELFEKISGEKFIKEPVQPEEMESIINERLQSFNSF
nr:phosphoribosylaminoimidazolesuccinocarboxamide synthase [Chitinophagaceae bacterium]